MAITDIKQLLPQDIYDAAVGAASPSAANVYATMNDITGALQDLQSVLDQGATYSGGASVNIATQYGGITLSDEDIGVATGSLTINAFAGTFLAFNDTLAGGGLQEIAIGGATYGGMVVTDGATSKGLQYVADYSAVGALDDRWIPDYKAVKDYADSLVTAGGIYDGDGLLQTGTTTVTMGTNNLLFTSTPVSELFYVDGTNGRLGAGLNTPGYGIHSTLVDTYLQNGSLGVGETPGENNSRISATIDGTDGLTIVQMMYPKYTTQTGTFTGSFIRSNSDKSGASSILYGQHILLQNTATAGTHTQTALWARANVNAATGATVTNVAGIFEALGTSTGGTVNNYAIRILDGSEGVDKVLRSDAAGNGSWVDPNTLVTGTNETLAEVLANGNSSGANDIITSNDKVIKAASGGGQLDLRAGTPGVNGDVLLSNDNGAQGKSGLALYDQGAVALYENGWRTFSYWSSGLGLNSYQTQIYDALFTAPVAGIEIRDDGDYAWTGTTAWGIVIGRTNVGLVSTGLQVGGQSWSMILGTERGTLNQGVENSVTLGGDQVRAKTSGVAYAGMFGLSDNVNEILLQQPVSIGADRIQSFQDADGVIALTSDITVNAVAQTYTVTNVGFDRSYDADLTSVAELADVLGTLITDLKTSGIIL